MRGVGFEKIYDAFIKAFEDYAVDVSYMTPSVMEKRAIKNGYDPENSVGVYANEELVGFTLVGTDLHFMPGVCGKSGQSVPVTDGQPTILIRQMVVGGKEV